MGKKVFSFCLWGADPKYTVGAVHNLITINNFYPEFECWIYLDTTTVPKSIVDNLHGKGAKIIERDKGGWHSMFWRFEPAGNADVDMVLCRDTDCRITQREMGAIKEWLESDKDFHVMRDHPYHTAYIMGGLWGARGEVVKNINELISNWKVLSQYQNDQLFLRRAVWPQVSIKSFIHDSCYQRVRQFPVPRDGLGFVGEIYTPDDKPANMGHRNLLRIYIGQRGELKR